MECAVKNKNYFGEYEWQTKDTDTTLVIACGSFKIDGLGFTEMKKLDQLKVNAFKDKLSLEIFHNVYTDGVLQIGLEFKNISEASEAADDLEKQFLMSREDENVGINLTEGDIAAIIMQPGFSEVVSKVRKLMKTLHR